MELENLKEAWAALDNRLKRNEKMNESIILEMMKSKAGKIVNRFIAIEIISVILLIAIIPYVIFRFDSFVFRYLARDITVISVLVISFIYPFWGIYKIHGLMKFDLSKNVSNNVYHVNRYNIQLKREWKIFRYFIAPVFVILAVLTYASMKVSMSWWSLLFCTFIACALYCYWGYKYYNKSIDSILKSLDEIRELKEE